MEESQWEQEGNVNSAKAHEFGPPRAVKWFLTPFLLPLHGEWPTPCELEESSRGATVS